MILTCISHDLYMQCCFFSTQKNYESMIHQYKKKLGNVIIILALYNIFYFSEDVQEMKKQLKAMNDKNMTYMQQNLDLEEVCVMSRDVM